MTELQWTPARLAALTLPQLVCLLHEDSPTATGAKDKESFLVMAARWERERAEWLGL